MFYLASYAAMLVGAFAVVMLVSGKGEREQSLGDYRGLARRHPWLGASLALFLFSLAGIPPTAGFISKVTVFSASFQAGYDWLVVLGVVASVVSAFFYVRLVVLMYLDEEVSEPAGPEAEAISPAVGGGTAAVATAVRARPRIDAPVATLAVAIPAAATLLFGILPQILFAALRSASAVRF
jgi:NADH-quinone oxidoreductase subunit N